MHKIRNFMYVKIHRRLVLSSAKRKEQEKYGIKTYFLNSYLKFFPTPSAQNVKIKTLLRYGGSGVWVETGTYLGVTAENLASAVSQVHTIEPSHELFEIARKRLDSLSNVTQYRGTSEETLSHVLSDLQINRCDEVNFWLDGHYSAGNTFRGLDETPIHHELSVIEKFMGEFSAVNIFIDDVRCFQPSTEEYESYPPLRSIMQWAKEHSMKSLLVHDILIMKKCR